MPLHYSYADGVGRMTFDFPEKKNALDQAARKEMERIVTQVRDDERVRALLITGTGGAFCWFYPHGHARPHEATAPRYTDAL